VVDRGEAEQSSSARDGDGVGISRPVDASAGALAARASRMLVYTKRARVIGPFCTITFGYLATGIRLPAGGSRGTG
jgi:hypothetical protein